MEHHSIFIINTYAYIRDEFNRVNTDKSTCWGWIVFGSYNAGCRNSQEVIMGKITNLLIGLVIVAFIMTTFIIYLADVGSNTGVTFNGSQYNQTYNKIAEVNQITEGIQGSQNTSVELSSTDILGSYFKQGYSAYRLTLKSGDITANMVKDSTEDLGLEDSSGGSIFQTMLMTIIILIVVIGVIIAVVVGKDV